MANRLLRLFILAGVGFLRLPGFIAATVFGVLLLAFTKSFGVPYLWPLIPFNYRAMKSILVRSPVPVQHIRPEILQPLDITPQPGPAFKRNRKK
ncbi:MAG: spore germination protein, partial [Syntrophomonadaceae bacterium]|jgi:stage V sporulation protein AF